MDAELRDYLFRMEERISLQIRALDGRMDKIDGRMDRLEGELRQQMILMRAMAHVILPEDALDRSLCEGTPEEIAALKRKMSSL